MVGDRDGRDEALEDGDEDTLDDLGLGRMAAKDKPYIGKALRFRPALQAPDRWSLVGIELIEPEKRLRGGSILFAATDEIKGHGRGYITSVTWSPSSATHVRSRRRGTLSPSVSQ